VAKKGPASDTVFARPLEVRLEGVGGDTERLIKKFTRKVKTDGILREHSQSLSFRRKRDEKPRRKKIFTAE
jgi:hypothetical protein